MSGNQMGMFACFALGFILSILAVIFALMKEKGAILISGFNFFTKEERKQYDEKKMSEDMRNQLALWAILFLGGGLLSYFLSFYLGIVTFIIWFILFIKEVKLDRNKAFEKYKL